MQGKRAWLRPADNGELLHLLRWDLCFGMFALEAVWGAGLGRKRWKPLVRGSKDKGWRGQWTLRAAGGVFPRKGCWQGFLTLRSTCQRPTHQQTPRISLLLPFHGSQPCRYTLALPHRSVLLLLAHTNVQTHGDLSSLKIFFFSVNFF